MSVSVVPYTIHFKYETMSIQFIFVIMSTMIKDHIVRS